MHVYITGNSFMVNDPAEMGISSLSPLQQFLNLFVKGTYEEIDGITVKPKSTLVV